MSSIFGAGQRANSDNTPATNIRIQSSIQGRPKAIGAGQNRASGNCIWYGDFTVTPASAPGGKGGGGVSGLFKGQPGLYNYSASFIISLGEGPISGIQTVYNGNAIDFLVTPPQSILNDLTALGITPTYGNTYGMTFLDGDYGQEPWSYLSSAHPSQALAYRGEALACFANLGLGGSPALPNFTFELLWEINSDIPSVGPDANPADWITAFLSNPYWGIGFPAALIGDLTAYQTWARASGMLISPVLTDQQAANSHLNDLMTATVADFRWSAGLLTVVPYAEQAMSGNGYTFTPDTTPVYDLTTDDFLANQGTIGNSSPAEKTAIVVVRKDPATVLNKVQVEYLDRSNIYNPVTIYDTNDAAIIAARRLRVSDLRQHHFFCLGSAASISASLQLRREQVVNQYQVTLPPQFILLDVMDIVTLTEANLGFSDLPVRIIEIQENADRSLTITAEDFLGTVTAPLYGRQQPLGAARNINVDPGVINLPIFFEPPDLLGNGLSLWGAISGANLSLWGGCNVWISSESDGSYTKIGSINGPARMGVLAAALPSVSAAFSGPTIDSADTLAVNLSESGGELASGSALDMTSLNTLCYCDGELLAYQNAMLVGANQYQLNPILRGAYGSTIGAHAAGANFARLDNLIFKYPFTADRIGSTIYLKFQGFNIFGGGLQSLDNCGAYPYTIKGSALSSPLPTVQNLLIAYPAGIASLSFDEVTDFRTGIRYRIFQGPSAATAQQVGDIAHPPFALNNTGTYYVQAYCQPVPGLVASSALSAGLEISGTLLIENPLAEFNQQTANWPGTLINFTRSGVSPDEILLLNNASGVDLGLASQAVTAADDFGLTTDHEIIAVIDLGNVG